MKTAMTFVWDRTKQISKKVTSSKKSFCLIIAFLLNKMTCLSETGLFLTDLWTCHTRVLNATCTSSTKAKSDWTLQMMTCSQRIVVQAQVAHPKTLLKTHKAQNKSRKNKQPLTIVCYRSSASEPLLMIKISQIYLIFAKWERTQPVWAKSCNNSINRSSPSNPQSWITSTGNAQHQAQTNFKMRIRYPITFWVCSQTSKIT